MAGLALMLILGCLQAGSAQVETSVRISPPITDQFPTVSFYLSVSDGDGRRIEGVTPSVLQVVEDGVTRPVQRLEEVEIGTRQLFIINTNQGMAVRDTRGRSRFQFVREALVDWWSQDEAALFAADDLSVVTGEISLVEHSGSAATAAAAIDQYQPTFSPQATNFDLLLQSLAYLEDPGPRQNAPSFVVFFTSLIRDEDDLALTNVIARANELGASVYPVLVDNPEAAGEDAFQFLQQLAEATGGTVSLLDRAEPQLGDLALRILSQRTQYKVSYESSINESGPHELQAQFTDERRRGVSEPRAFQVDVMAPAVTFVQPPTEIVRESDDPTTSIEQLPPTEQTLQLLINFPDGHSRGIRRSQLLVDGQVATERAQPPFDALHWDLSGLRQDGSVQVQAVVEDSLGLQGRSLSHQVEVRVVPPPTGLAALRPALGSLLVIVGGLMIGAVAAVLLYAYVRRAPRGETDLSETQSPSHRRLDRASLRSPAGSRHEAFLIPIEDGGAEGAPIPLTGADITLGSDASLTTFPFSEPSLSGLHARLIRQAGGRYLLRDQGSISGSWVNDDPVPEEGVPLRSGDIIHLGRLALRFQRPDDPEQAEIHIEPIDGQDKGPEHGEEAAS